MIDRDLAELYGVETRVLNQAVKRNSERFPDDFMFRLTQSELQDWISQIVISNREIKGLRKPPSAFTEHGILMLSSVLHSNQAIQINIEIMRIFNQVRQYLASQIKLAQQLMKIENQSKRNTNDIEKIFRVIDQLVDHKNEIVKNKNRIGF